ncbi:hypothetical protein IE81DRAFT_246253 [Ceraceosorus guamensis]|uniref:SGF29 C-terminal domain-containing protein n=1 Tax=Ceraceosorus guamensis TaxID=1522189 RepID=A0A316VQX3_9BASI|nr:hypothetical protein IE81DRAFT_246253 [Ceraceosorus guamensis]PWN40059.1 hypothetical protein IE81DRAFT_246253 [Ceraceosorus guamensis]
MTLRMVLQITETWMWMWMKGKRANLTMKRKTPERQSPIPRQLFCELWRLADEILETLSVLNALRPTAANDPPAKAMGRKKRRFSSVSMSPSLTPAPAQSPPPVSRASQHSHDKSDNRGGAFGATLDAAPSGSASTSSAAASSAVRSSESSSNLVSGSTSALGSAARDAHNTSISSANVSATPSASKSRQTPRGYVDPAKARREVLHAQLPLAKGRRVAFRQPTKSRSERGPTNGKGSGVQGGAGAGKGGTGGGGGGGSSSNNNNNNQTEEEGETWILAVVMECINNDRNRYVVQDAEDRNSPTVNTTLKAIVPLPESVATLPPQDYAVGQWVMGMYPDTSCFYRAKVLGGGPGLTGRQNPAKLKSRTQELLAKPYQLEFEDDNNRMHEVSAGYVVERP